MNELKLRRTELQMTQAELGRRMSIDPSIIRHVEAGRLQPYPRFRRLAAQILEAEERELFPEVEPAR